jgi:hypothetical protein
MQGLFDKVIKGNYPRIPKKFSADLAMVIKGLLQVKAKSRPTCDQILGHPVIAKRIKKLGLDEFEDNSILMKTIQPFNDPNQISFKLPAPTYTSTEASMLMRDRTRKQGNLPDIKKNSFDYRNQYSGISDATGDDDEDLTNHKNIYSSKKNKKDYKNSPYVKNQYANRPNINPNSNKNESANSVISAKRSVTESDVSNILPKPQSNSILDPLDPTELERKKSQESVINSVSPEYKNNPKYTAERGRESKISSEKTQKHHKQLKSENLGKKAIEPSEFKMKEEVDARASPSRRMMENKKSRMRLDQSKELKDRQSRLSSKKKLNRNESQKTLSQEQVDSTERGEHSKSKKLIKNLREHIALKLYEHNIPKSNYHRVLGKGSHNSSNNSYIQKMLDAYNVFNYPQNLSNQNKYNYKLRKNLRKEHNRSKFREGEVGILERNRSQVDPTGSRNDHSPGYPREKSVILPELSRSPGVSLISGRKKSIISLKKKADYIRSGKRHNPKVASLGNNLNNKSTDLEAMPSISKQLDRILNSHKMNIGKNTKKNMKNSYKYKSPNHVKIKSISGENIDRRELAIEGLPNTIVKPNNKNNATKSYKSDLPALISEHKA